MNDHLITLRVILASGNHFGIDEDFVYNGGYIKTVVHSIMMKRIMMRGLSNLQPFSHGHILSERLVYLHLVMHMIVTGVLF